jgi:hypothetical protein
LNKNKINGGITMEIEIKLTKEETAELAEAVGILKYIEELALKDELVSWVEEVGLSEYIAKMAIAFLAVSKYADNIEGLIELLKNEGVL